ncbi:hypothetical protein [Adlercreutzia caecimuris]|uniref:hypothetical protein n=1 Tax=Adlercreutzia caecimuris TaxID=671266 RepID=UPI00272C6099|nr:hypothetical protein [Adlercreutzia caecimuris]
MGRETLQNEIAYMRHRRDGALGEVCGCLDAMARAAGSWSASVEAGRSFSDIDRALEVLEAKLASLRQLRDEVFMADTASSAWEGLLGALESAPTYERAVEVAAGFMEERGDSYAGEQRLEAVTLAVSNLYGRDWEAVDGDVERFWAAKGGEG